MADLPVDTIAQRLRWLRICAGLTGAQLAQRAELSEATVSRIENGGVLAPSIESLAALSDALGVQLPWLYRAEGAEPSPAAIRQHVGAK